MADVRDPHRDQPLPSPGQQSVQDALIGAVQERRAYGVRKYGRPLETHNGRDALTDAWEEALDLVTYLTQMRLERGDQLPAAPSAVAQSAPAETALRDRIADALSEARRPGLGGMTEADAVAHMAAAVLAVLPAADPAAEEAYRLAVSAALRLGTGANWEAIRDRAEDLTAEVEELTEARVRQMEAAASVDRATVLNEAAEVAEGFDIDASPQAVAAELRSLAAEAPEVIGQPDPPATGESTDLPAILRWAADHLATIANATPGEDVRQPGMQDAIDRLRWLAVEAQQQTETPCGPAPDQCDPETGEPCDVHEVERAHAEGDHEHCGKECEVAMPSEQLRNAILCRAIPGSAGMLDELLRRAAVVPAGAGEDPAHETREAEDPARIDRLRPEFFEHASVEAIDSQIRRAETQQRSWGDRAQTMAILRQARVKQKELGDWPAVEAQQPTEADGPRTVCVCGHTKGEHITVSGRLLCDACDPDSTENLVCKEFEAL
jgi:hypothetical protein